VDKGDALIEADIVENLTQRHYERMAESPPPKQGDAVGDVKNRMRARWGAKREWWKTTVWLWDQVGPWVLMLVGWQIRKQLTSASASR
jgi:hypothetical protein